MWKFSRSVTERLRKNNSANSIQKEWTVIKEVVKAAKEHIGTMKRGNRKRWIRQEI